MYTASAMMKNVTALPRRVTMPRWTCARHVTIWPQWPYDDETRAAKPVGDPKFRWPPNAPKEFEPGEVMTHQEVQQLRKKIYSKIWEDKRFFFEQIILFSLVLGSHCLQFPGWVRTWFGWTGRHGNVAFGSWKSAQFRMMKRPTRFCSMATFSHTGTSLKMPTLFWKRWRKRRPIPCLGVHRPRDPQEIPVMPSHALKLLSLGTWHPAPATAHRRTHTHNIYI